ncbi:hypothetical protein ACFWZJ_23150 [Streptomyces massasporeus]
MPWTPACGGWRNRCACASTTRRADPALGRSRLVRFPHVGRPDTFPESGGAADARPRWQRIDPRP